VELNNREIAMLVWTGLLLLWMLSRRDMRPALGGVLRAFLQPTILGWLLAFVAYLSGCVWLAEQAGLWQSQLVNETAFWFLATGFVLFMGVNEVSGQDDFLWKAAKRVLALGLLAEIFINLVVMPLWVEFLFLPVVTFVVLMQVFVEGKEEYAQIKKLADWLSAFIGLGLFAFVAISLLLDPAQLDPAYLARLLALPLWLTLLSLPFIYLLGLFVAYEKAFRRIDFWATEKRNARKAKLAMLTGLRFRARRVGQFNGAWQKRLLEATSTSRTAVVMSDFLRQQKEPANA
jgi:hypothetical protein